MCLTMRNYPSTPGTPRFDKVSSLSDQSRTNCFTTALPVHTAVGAAMRFFTLQLSYVVPRCSKIASTCFMLFNSDGCVSQLKKQLNFAVGFPLLRGYITTLAFCGVAGQVRHQRIAQKAFCMA